MILISPRPPRSTVNAIRMTPIRSPGSREAGLTNPMPNRKQIIKEHIGQDDLFRVLSLSFQEMVRREHHLIERNGLKRSVNAAALDSLALDMHYLQTHYRLVKK